MAVVEHPDMPKSLFGIQGLNPWNILLAVVVAAWARQRSREGLKWDLPKGLVFLLFLYLVIIVVGFVRLAGDHAGIDHYVAVRGGELNSFASMLSEFIINCIKWVIPGLLLFDGVRDRARMKWALFAVLFVYVALAIQVIKWMPLSTLATGADLGTRSLKILEREVGYHRVNIAVMLAGGAWAVFVTRALVEKRMQLFWITSTSFVVAFGLALTGGRAGYATWAAVGVVLALIRWRKYLILGPVLVMAVLSFVPAVRDRIMNGFTDSSRDSNTLIQETEVIQGGKADLYTVTAGRNVAWPAVIAKIKEAPFVGHGREAMQNTGVATQLYVNYREDFPHPHNAYLQWLLDNGWLGAIPVFLFYLIIVKRSISLFRDSRNPLFVAAGGISLAMVSALLIGAIGSQTFYPREGAVGMWCAIFLMLRMYVEREKILQGVRESKAEKSSKSWDQWLWPTPAPAPMAVRK
jgi:O-antigen ligase